MLTHRPLIDADIERICTFPRDARELYFLFPKASWPLTPEQVRESLGARRDPTVVLQGGKVVGYANFATFDEGRSASVGNVSVAPDTRRAGVAKYLLHAMMDRAFGHHGLPELVLRCFNTNTPALILYGKLGFVPVAVEERATPWGERIALFTMRMGREVWEQQRRHAA